MVKSIRWRLQLWYAAFLLAVIGGFAGLLYYRVRSAKLQQIDEQLEAAGHYLDATLRGFPPHELEGPPLFPRPAGMPPLDPDRPRGPFRPGEPGFRPGEPPPRPGEPGFRPGEPPPAPPGRKPREQFLAELDFPPRLRFPGEPEAERPYFVVWRSDDSVLKASPGVPPGLTPRAFVERPQWLHGGGRREVVLPGPRRTRILVGKPVGREMAELTAFCWQLVGSGCLVLVAGLVGGWLISGQVVRPIAAISRTASQISASHLSERIDTRQIDTELVGLAQVLNDMLARLEAEFERQARFTADASHELRTPLAVVYGHLELALSRARSPEEYRDTIKACLHASGRMRSLIEGLLTLARADAGRLDIERKPLDLRLVVEEALAPYSEQAERCDVALSAVLPPVPVVVAGDRTFLVRVLANLVANALRHTPAGGQVRVALSKDEDAAVLCVEDSGSGIPDEDQPRIFERFYRVDKARSRASGGCGLGLAICKSLVEAHGGAIRFHSTVGRGTTFIVRLPLSPAAPVAADRSEIAAAVPLKR